MVFLSFVCIFLLRKKKDPIIVMLFAGVLNVIGKLFHFIGNFNEIPMK